MKQNWTMYKDIFFNSFLFHDDECCGPGQDGWMMVGMVSRKVKRTKFVEIVYH